MKKQNKNVLIYIKSVASCGEDCKSTSFELDKQLSVRTEAPKNTSFKLQLKVETISDGLGNCLIQGCQ